MILNQQHEVRLALRPLESFLRRVQRELGLKPSGMTVCLVSAAGMARLNQNFRRKQGPTDVLSFPTAAKQKPVRFRHRLHVTNSGRHEYLGDIAISPATTFPARGSRQYRPRGRRSARRRRGGISDRAATGIRKSSLDIRVR